MQDADGEGIKINMTLCCLPNQALLIAKAVRAIAAVVGRSTTSARTAWQLIRDIKTIYTNYKLQDRILAASFAASAARGGAALAGAHVGTLP